MIDPKNEWWGWWSNIATIITALVAVWIFFRVKSSEWCKRVKLEEYLKGQKDKDDGLRTITHLMRHVGLSEAEIWTASAQSKKIIRRTRKNPESGLAETMFFGYSEHGDSN